MPHDDTHEESVETNFSRRSLLAALGAGSATALAGCVGDQTADGGDGGNGNGSDGGGGNDSDGGGGGTVDRTFRAPTTTNLGQINFNLYTLKNTPDLTTTQTMYTPLTRYVPRETEFKSLVAKSWEMSDGSATVEIRSDLTWHNGDKFTADDLVAQFKLSKITGASLWTFANSVSAESETTVQFEVDKVNPTVFWHTFLEDQAFVKRELYEQFLQQLEDASTEKETNQVVSNLRDYRIGPQDAIGHGLFRLENIDNQGVLLKRYEEHPWSGYINFDTIMAKSYADAQGEYQAILSNNLDFVDYRGGMPPNLHKQMPEGWDTITVSAGEVIQMAVNPDKEPMGDRRVRQAVAAVIDPSEYPPIGGEYNKEATPGMVTGLSNQQDDQYLQEISGDFTNYGGPDTSWVKTEMATSLLQDAGYSKQSGTWVDGSGSPLTIDVKYPAGWSGAVKMYQHAAQQLSEFGIKSSPVGVENTTVFSKTIPNGNYKLMFMVLGGYHPYDRYNAMLGSLTDYPGTPDLNQTTMEVPWPVGNPDGDMKKVNVDERIKKLGRTADKAEEKRLTRELAWVTNQWVPFIECWEKKNTHRFRRDTFDWPPDDYDPLYMNSPLQVMALKEGNLMAKPK